MFKHNYQLQRPLEDDDIPLCQYVIPYHHQQQQQPMPYQWKLRQPSPAPRYMSGASYFPPIIITQPQPVIRRPFYLTTPSSLLDTFSDEDEDDEDLVPIAVLQSPIRNQQQFQSAAEKYKEKVKAQLQ
ncbi:putative cell survival pathways protein [Mucor velutinosus]|uniref:Cell survival pathways protein n=1 Tax=Mucor velutinosus TaxID=708070 RepID=A0AAN7D4G0_9FUNG|nr:putative cell survival pathways protein [Mucor velutinosus]